jgi:hypothetical protein
MELLYDISIEIVGAIITGAFIWIVQAVRYCRHLKRNFDNSFFDVYYKGKPNHKVRTITLNVKGHTIYYSGENIHKGSNEGTFEGELIMNVINLKIGEGIHYHDNYDGFNFPKVFIKDTNTIFIETSYLSNKESTDEFWIFKQHYQAYILKRNSNFSK